MITMWHSGVTKAITLLLLVGLSTSAFAYTRLGSAWPNETAQFLLKSSSNKYDAAFIEAMSKWNNLSDFSFSYRTSGFSDPCATVGSPDRKNSYRFSTDNCGNGWNSTTLAVATFWWNDSGTIDSDIVFNSGNYEWDVYDGNIRSSQDFRRVAVHELGHTLGLGHSASNNAIMYARVTNTVVAPQADDINGLRAIYGGTGTGTTPKRTLTLSTSGTGSVTSSPAGINCPSDCSQSYNQGTSVSLTAAPASGWQLTAWSGACTGTGACQVSMSSNRSVSATFERLPPTQRTLTVTTSGNGRVTSVPAGINCPSDCTQSYNQGTSVSISAIPANGWEFAGWGGSCAGAGACTVSMSTAIGLSAKFVKSTTNNPKGEVPLSAILLLLLEN